MSNFNKVMLMGRITREIELRYTPKGTAVADISLAVNRKYRDGEETKEETTFVDVTLWGRTAEVAHQYSGKGRPLFIEGRLQTDTWEDKETGKKRSKMKVVADNIQLMGGKSDHDSSSPSVNQHKMQGHPMHQGSAGAEESDDIPF